jgi:hypothetical protein
MKGLRKLVYGMLVLLVVTAASCGAKKPDDSEEKGERSSVLLRLRSPRAREVDEARARLLAEERDLTRELLRIVGDSGLRNTNRHAVLSAIALLGDLRAAAAAGALCDLLLYGWEGDIRDPMHDPLKVPRPDVAGPAVPALSKIGIPALKPVTEKLIAIQEGTENRGRLQLHCLWVIKDILGPRLGKEYIAHLLETDERAANSQFVKDGLRFMDLQMMAIGEGTDP